MGNSITNGIVGVVVILSYLGSPSGTVYHIGQILTARGIAWTATKVTESVNKDASLMINFTGWSIAGVSMVRILWNAKNSIGYVGKFLDWVTFWN